MVGVSFLRKRRPFAFELSSLNLPHPTLALTPSERASSYYTHPCVVTLLALASVSFVAERTQVFLLQLPLLLAIVYSDIGAYNY